MGWPKAVVFDFDGTLADSYAAIAASVNYVRAVHGLAALPLGEVTRYVGRGAHYLLKHTVGGDDVQSDLAKYKEHHPTVMRSLTVLLPGAKEALTAVRDRGMRSGICSNKPRAFTLDLVDAMGIGNLVEVVVGPEDAPRPKPAPEMLLVAAERLGVGIGDVLYVGDMTVDIQTARAAGAVVWAVPTGSEAREVVVSGGADRVLKDLHELAAWIVSEKIV